MSGKSDWPNICQDVGARLWDATPKTIESAKKLQRQILQVLTKASDEEVLKTKPHEIHNLLKLETSEKDGKGVFEIVGGKRNFKRMRDIPHFERFDGCWFDFTILIDQHPKSADILGFSFEIRFPDDYPVKFLRIDLNTPGHNNDMRGMRFHVHPGNDNLMIHSAPMSPLEILHLFLYGLSIPDRPRSS
ncbi:MAG TPA: hypothetical protein IGS52_06410 [Oscillatoriaceae cyanobacterium M33_DOE_052]|uniref:Uncharacterized protein n=1 Tax=Planktothricoides sp. SpSt-374 TaxID=2282167 RepID=A0A7C3ZVQ5_9CYAN|nr:hypothetical protein [Oscillatoriaceae cyanobacterium M33_DOE_052]